MSDDNKKMNITELKKHVENSKEQGEDTTQFTSHVGNDMDPLAEVPFWERNEIMNRSMFDGEMHG